MAEFSMFFPDTTDPGPQVGDGRPYTDAEWRIMYRYLWLSAGEASRGVIPNILNELAVTVAGANDLDVATGAAIVYGGFYCNNAVLGLAPASAPGGQTRQDSVILELDLVGTGVGQYKIRCTYKQGTAGAPPAMTQTANIWQIRLYNYTIDDAGAITGLSDQRAYIRASIDQAHGDLSGLANDDHVQYYNAARHTAAAHNALGLDHGSLIGLGDDDHPQYMDVAGVRHTVAAHDALNIDADTLDGLHAADILAGGVFLGCMVMFNGSLGGSDGHRPIVAAVAQEGWHQANGETVNGVVTLDMRARFPIGDNAGAYLVGASGGSATKNLQHSHAAGTLAAASGGSHNHGLTWQTPGGLFDLSGTYDVSTAASGTHTHTVSGSTANGGSTTQDIMPPWRGVHFVVYVG